MSRALVRASAQVLAAVQGTGPPRQPDRHTVDGFSTVAPAVSSDSRLLLPYMLLACSSTSGAPGCCWSHAAPMRMASSGSTHPRAHGRRRGPVCVRT